MRALTTVRWCCRRRLARWRHENFSRMSGRRTMRWSWSHPAGGGCSTGSALRASVRVSRAAAGSCGVRLARGVGRLCTPSAAAK